MSSQVNKSKAELKATRQAEWRMNNNITTAAKPSRKPTAASMALPTREIRAHRPTPTTITVYQAYNTTIGHAAVASQNLAAAPEFSVDRMTWIKPSWCWMLYRAGYSYKDDNQACILALTMRTEDFWTLLRMAKLTTASGGDKLRPEDVRVQWDPERGPRIDRSNAARSIQVGIPKVLVKRWVDEMIVGIEDVTDRARRLKKALDEEIGKKRLKDEELVEMGLTPREDEVEVPEDIRTLLKMDYQK